MSSSCGAPGLTSSNYDVTSDAQRFLMIQDDDVATTSSDRLVLVVGFAQELAYLLWISWLADNATNRS